MHIKREQLSLDQLLADPLIRQVMSSDDVEEVEVRKLMQNLNRRQPPSRYGAAPTAVACGR